MSLETQEHILQCSVCSHYAEYLVETIDVYLGQAEPPNAHLLWQKISRAIEEEKKRRPSLWARFWTFSLAQVIAAVFAIMALSSALTAVAVKSFLSEREDLSKRKPNFAERILANMGLVESPQEERERRIREKQEAIEYWSLKIQQRRNQWDDKIKQVFDRNLQEIDSAVAEYKKILEENPYDDISGEMLDSAMKEKLELLREFAEL
ncbi:MAG: hypothetical protein RML33_06130 [Acidobacteriota bacterium]|nr:hypothetical protein [Acidobacteriota bacterium]